MTQNFPATGSQVTMALPVRARSAWSTTSPVTPAGAGSTVRTSGGPATGGPVPSAIVGSSVIVPVAVAANPSWIRPLVLALGSRAGSTHDSAPPATEQAHVGLSTPSKVTPGASGMVTVGWTAGPACAGTTAACRLAADGAGTERPGPSAAAAAAPLPTVTGMAAPRPA